ARIALHGSLVVARAPSHLPLSIGVLMPDIVAASANSRVRRRFARGEPRILPVLLVRNNFLDAHGVDQMTGFWQSRRSGANDDIVFLRIAANRRLAARERAVVSEGIRRKARVKPNDVC